MSRIAFAIAYLHVNDRDVCGRLLGGFDCRSDAVCRCDLKSILLQFLYDSRTRTLIIVDDENPNVGGMHLNRFRPLKRGHVQPWARSFRHGSLLGLQDSKGLLTRLHRLGISCLKPDLKHKIAG